MRAIGLFVVALTLQVGQILASPPGAVDPNCLLGPELPPMEMMPAVIAAPIKDPPTPVVSLAVRVLASAQPGEDLEYLICVENPTFAAAHHVVVRNPLPAHAKFMRARPAPTSAKVFEGPLPRGEEPEIVWELGTLEACSKREILLVLSPNGTGDVVNCARVQFEHGQCVCTKVPKAVLGLKKYGPTQAAISETLTYKLTVTNSGAADARDVKVTDSLPAGLEHASGKKQLLFNIGTLGAGQSRTVEYEVVAKVTGKHCNQAVAVADGGLHEEVETCVTVVDAKLAITKAGPARRYVNLPATYDFTVVNEGTATLTDVAITDRVPEGATFMNASDAGSLVEDHIRWAIGTLEPGASRTVHVSFRAKGAGKVCNRVTATSSYGLSAQAEICTEFIGYSALLLEVVDTDDPIEIGEDTSYLIIVKNQGSVPAANVRVTAQVPEQEQVLNVAGPATHMQAGQAISFAPLTLPGSGEVRFTITVRALRAGDVRFRVELNADMLTAGPVHEEESTTLYAEPPPAREGKQLSRPRLGS